MSILKTINLSKEYPGKICALNNINITIDKPELIAILGPSGAGKSTLVRSINRLVQKTTGQIYFQNKDISNLHGLKLKIIRQKMGMIFQQFNLINRLTVLENVLIGRLGIGRSPLNYMKTFIKYFSAAEESIAFECLKQVGIENKAFLRADTLSGGQQQRVAIARALAQNPHLLLADEPIASLDPKSSKIVMDIMAKINQEQEIPVIVNLHQYEYAKEYATRIIGMYNGRIVFDGPTSDLTNDCMNNIYHGVN